MPNQYCQILAINIFRKELQRSSWFILNHGGITHSYSLPLISDAVPGRISIAVSRHQ